MPEKVCVKCGTDVASLKRTKDPKGNYWCMDCYQAAVAAKQPAEPVPPADEYDLTAELLDEAAAFQDNVCQNCRSPMPKDAAICVNCGYNVASGKQAHTRVKKEKEPSAAGAAGVKALGLAGSMATTWPMAMGFALIGGSVAGLIGAGIWAAVAYNVRYEHSLLAWVIGGAVGFGVLVGARGYAGLMTGVMAAVIAIAAVIGGRMWAISLIVDDLVAEIDFEEFERVDRSEILSYLATDIADEWEAAGERLRWPPGYDNDIAWEQHEFPEDVWTEAQTRWNVWDEAQRDQYVAATESEMSQVSQDLQNFTSTDNLQQVFFDTLSPIDFLFFGLAIITAAGVGSGGELSMRGDD